MVVTLQLSTYLHSVVDVVVAGLAQVQRLVGRVAEPVKLL
jgi:hypothetical protein